jgi:2-(1,2-epoxy-1,2-dihydrophenyl)acetyl-CoA isomerase
MSFETIRYEMQGAVAVVTLNRPERLNAISVQLRDEVHAALAKAQADDGVRVLVITGEGRGFCAGADLAARPGSEPRPDNQDTKLDDVLWMGRFALALHNFDKPLIMAINGVAAGGGMGLALSADMRIGSEQTRFKTVFAERALGPDCGVSYFLPRIVGSSRALDLLLTCRMVDAQEAYRLGLIDRLVPHDKLMEETLAIAQAMADGPPLALRITKRAVHKALDTTLEEAVRAEAAGYVNALKAVNDQAESAAAFVEKRKAVFTGT